MAKITQSDTFKRALRLAFWLTFSFALSRSRHFYSLLSPSAFDGLPIGLGPFILAPIFFLVGYGLSLLLNWRTIDWGWRGIRYPLIAITGWIGVSLLWQLVSGNYQLVDLLTVVMATGSAWLVMLYFLNEKPPMLGLFSILIVVHGVVSVGQFILQHDLGLAFLGERVLDPQANIAVVMNGGQRWLRAYGLTPHPGDVSRLFAFGLLFVISQWSGLGHFGKLRTGQTDKQKNFVVVLVGFVGLIVALVRGGWLAFMAGFFVLMLPTQINGGLGNILRALWRKWWPILTVIFGCALIFAALYSDLLIGRVTQPKNYLEDRSISERISENETAISIIKEHPWMGIGAGNYLHHVRLSAPLGTNVHNIPLLMGAETGLLGMALWIILLLMPLLRKGALSKNRAGMVLWVSYLVISLVHRQPGMVMEPEAGMVFGLLLAGVAVTQLES